MIQPLVSPKRKFALIEMLEKMQAENQLTAVDQVQKMLPIGAPSFTVLCDTIEHANALVRVTKEINGRQWGDIDEEETIVAGVRGIFKPGNPDDESIHKVEQHGRRVTIQIPKGNIANALEHLSVHFNSTHIRPPYKPAKKAPDFHEKDKFVLRLIEAAMADGSITHIKKSSKIFGSNKIEIDCKDAKIANALADKMDGFSTADYNDSDGPNSDGRPVNTKATALAGRKIFFELENRELIETYRQMIEKFNRDHPRPKGRGRGGDDDFDFPDLIGG